MTKQAEEIKDTDLDEVAGGDQNHKDWIIIQSMSQSVRAPRSRSNSDSVPVEDFSLNYEEIKVTY